VATTKRTSNIRTFAKLFRDLSDSQRKEMERALSDLENSEEITNLSSTLEFLRRKQNFSMPVPQLVTNNTSKGAVISWEAIKDQRAGAYEVEVSTQANFSTSTKVMTFGTNVILEGLSATTYVRVRAVRTGGTTGPFSDTAVVTPFLFTIVSRTEEAFYFKLTNSTSFTVLGGSGSTFDYEPIRPGPEGFSMVFGFVNMYADPEVAIRGTPDVTIKIIETTNLGESIRWLSTASDHFGAYSIGPFCIQHPETGNVEYRLEVQDSNPPNPFYVSEILWCHLNSVELGSQETTP